MPEDVTATRDTFGARFGRLVKARRGRQSQASLALEALGSDINKSTISRLETGKISLPNNSTVFAIAEVLDISPSEIEACRSGSKGGLPDSVDVALPPVLRDMFMLSFSNVQEDASDQEILAHLHQKSDDWLALITGVRALEARHASSAELEIEAATEDGDLERLDMALARAEQSGARALDQSAERVVKLRLHRAQSLLLRDEPERAFNLLVNATSTLPEASLSKLGSQGASALIGHALGYGGDGFKLAKQLLAVCNLNKDDPKIALLLANALIGDAAQSGSVAAKGQLSEAIDCLTAAIERTNPSQDQSLWMRLTNSQAVARQRLCSYLSAANSVQILDVARHSLQAARDHLSSVGSPKLHCRLLLSEASVLRSKANLLPARLAAETLDAAERSVNAAIGLSLDEQDQVLQALAEMQKGNILSDKADHAPTLMRRHDARNKALDSFDQAREYVERSGSKRELGQLDQNRASVILDILKDTDPEKRAARLAEAVRLLEGAASIQEELGLRTEKASGSLLLSRAILEFANVTEQDSTNLRALETDLDDTLKYYSNSHSHHLEAEARLALARLYVTRAAVLPNERPGDIEDATRHLNAARGIFDDRSLLEGLERCDSLQEELGRLPN